MGGNASPSYAYFLFRDKPSSVRTNPPRILNRDQRLTRPALILANGQKEPLLEAFPPTGSWFYVFEDFSYLLFCLKLRSKQRLKVIWFYFAFLFHIMAFFWEISGCLFF